MSMRPKFLIIEDDEDDLFLAKRVLSKKGFQDIYHAADGRHAIDYLMGNGTFSNRQVYPFPDVVLIDLKIPEINGYQVAEWINSQPQFSELRRFVLSSSGEERDRRRMSDANVTGYFVKPLTLLDVGKIVEQTDFA